MVETVRFVSEYRQGRYVRKPYGQQVFPNGNVVDTEKEVVYEFQNGALELRVGQDILNDGWNPQTGEFDLPQDAIAWLRSHPDFGNKVYEVAPDAPDPAPLFVEVGKLEAAGDLDGLIEMGNRENESWGREPVLDAIRGAVERLTVVEKPVKG